MKSYISYIILLFIITNINAVNFLSPVSYFKQKTDPITEEFNDNNFEILDTMTLTDKNGISYSMEYNHENYHLDIYSNDGDLAGFAVFYMQNGNTLFIQNINIFLGNKNLATELLQCFYKILPAGYVVKGVIDNKESVEYLLKIYKKNGVSDKSYLTGYNKDECKIGHIYDKAGFSNQKIEIRLVKDGGNPVFIKYAWRNTNNHISLSA